MRGRLTAAVATAAAMVATLLPGAAMAVRAAPIDCTTVVHNVWVDAGNGAFGETPVPGHNWEYTDFFPRGGSGAVPQVETGQCITFAWDPAGDSLHTVAFLKTTDTPSETNNAWAQYPFASPDTEGGETGEGFEANGTAFNPSGNCGAANNACPYDGNTFTNSGGLATGSFSVQLQIPNFTGTLYYYCLIHPGMFGSLDVIQPDGGGSTAAAEKTAAQNQYNADVSEATTAENAANSAATNTAPIAGTAGAGGHVEVAEMFPGKSTTAGCPTTPSSQGLRTPCWLGTINITAGQTVKWTTQTQKDPHTVTFPQGSGSDSLDPFPPLVCEGTPDSPTTAGPPTFGCSTFPEQHLNGAPAGGTVISSASTAATSGLLGSAPSGFPQSYSYSFPNAGTFTYQCRIHDNMTGQVLAAAVVVPSPSPTPSAAALAQTGQPRTEMRGTGWYQLPLALLLLTTIPALVVWRRHWARRP